MMPQSCCHKCLSLSNTSLGLGAHSLHLPLRREHLLRRCRAGLTGDPGRAPQLEWHRQERERRNRDGSQDGCSADRDLCTRCDCRGEWRRGAQPEAGDDALRAAVLLSLRDAVQRHARHEQRQVHQRRAEQPPRRHRAGRLHKPQSRFRSTSKQHTTTCSHPPAATASCGARKAHRWHFGPTWPPKQSPINGSGRTRASCDESS